AVVAVGGRASGCHLVGGVVAVAGGAAWSGFGEAVADWVVCPGDEGGASAGAAELEADACEGVAGVGAVRGCLWGCTRLDDRGWVAGRVEGVGEVVERAAAVAVCDFGQAAGLVVGACFRVAVRAREGGSG